MNPDEKKKKKLVHSFLVLFLGQRAFETSLSRELRGVEPSKICSRTTSHMSQRFLRSKRPAEAEPGADETETIPSPMPTTTLAQHPRPPPTPPSRPLTLLDLPLDAWAAILDAGGSRRSSTPEEDAEDDEEEEELARPSPPGSGLQPTDLACLRLTCRSLDETFSDGEGASLLAPSRLALRASQRAAAWLLAPRRREPRGLSSSRRASTVRALWLDLVDDGAAELLGAALVGRRGGRSTLAPAAPFLESLDLFVAQLPSLRAAADAQVAGAPPPVLDVAAFVPRISSSSSSSSSSSGATGYRGLRHLGVHGAAASLRSAASKRGGRRLRNLVSLSLDTAHSGAVWSPFYRGWGAVADLGLAAAAEGVGGEDEAESDDDDDDADAVADAAAASKEKEGREEEKNETSLAATPNLRSLALRLSPSPRDSWRGAAEARLPTGSLTALTLMVNTPLRDELGEPLRAIAKEMPRLRRLRVVNKGGGAPRAMLLPPDDGGDGGGGGAAGSSGSVGSGGLLFPRSLALSLEVSRSPLLDARTDCGPGFPSPATATALESAGRGGSGGDRIPRQVAPSRAMALGSLVELSVGSGTAPRRAGSSLSSPPPFPSVAVADLSVLSGAPRLERLELRDFGLVRGLGERATPRLRSLAIRVSARYAACGVGGGGGSSAGAAGEGPPPPPPPPWPLVVVEWPRLAPAADGGGSADGRGQDAGMPLLHSLEVACGGAGGVQFRLLRVAAEEKHGDDDDDEDEGEGQEEEEGDREELEAAGRALGVRLQRLCLVAGGCGMPRALPSSKAEEGRSSSSSPSWWHGGFLTAAAAEFCRRRRRWGRGGSEASGGDEGDGGGAVFPERVIAAPPDGGGGDAADGDGDDAAGSTTSSDCCLWPVRVLASEESLLGPAGASGAALRSVAATAGGAPRPLLREIFGRGGLGAGEGAAFAALGPLPPPAL